MNLVDKNTRNKRIIIVDDEEHVVSIIRCVVESEGYSVETAENGLVASRMIDEDHFDGVITDCNMPGQSGLDLYLHCRSTKPGLAKRFLFLTGDVVAPETMSLFTTYQLPFLTKPFDLRELVVKVREALEGE